MPLLKLTDVLAYSSEDSNHPVENLLKPDSYLKWKAKANHNEKQEHAILKLEKLSTIRSIDIGNEHSAFVEVLVAREGTDFQVLLVASSFMSPLESRNSSTLNRVRMFGPDKLNKNIAEQKWDRIKLICTQPFNKNVQYGLTFVKIYSPDIKETSMTESKLGRFTMNKEEEDSISVGSFFTNKKKDKEKEPILTGSAAIRAASKASLTPESSTLTKRPVEESSNPTEMGFYQLKKKAKESPIPKTKDQPDTKNSKAENINPKPPENLTESKREVKDENSLRNESATRKRKSRPFKYLMKDVVFVMSGYQNPERGQLRDSLTAMGAKYKSDWGEGCTHLICAFKNTPKYQTVKGKGKIVSAKWVQESFKKKIRLPWRRFSLEKNRNEDESEEDVWATEICPDIEEEEEKGTSLRVAKEPEDTEPMDDSEDTDDEIKKALEANKTNGKKEGHKARGKTQHVAESQEDLNGPASEENYDADTDVDEEDTRINRKKDTSGLALPPLKDFFKGKVFFFYGSIREGKRRSLQRYISAFQGKVSDYMSGHVQFVLTDDSWDPNFDEALNDHPSIQFVKPHWIWKCCDKEKIVPPQPFLIVPKEQS